MRSNNNFDHMENILFTTKLLLLQTPTTNLSNLLLTKKMNIKTKALKKDDIYIYKQKCIFKQTKKEKN